MPDPHRKLHPLESAEDHDVSAFTSDAVVKVNAAGTALESGLDAGLLAQATETARGTVELATNAEVATGTDTERAVTPAGLKSDHYRKSEVDTLIDATLKPPEAYDPAGGGQFPITYGGAGVQQGDSFRIVTADTLGSGTIVNPEDLLIALVDTPGQTDANWMVVESNRDQATETIKGVAEIATQAEVDAGTDNERIITPAKLAGAGVGVAGFDYHHVEVVSPVSTDQPTGTVEAAIVQFTPAFTGNYHIEWYFEVSCANNNTETDVECVQTLPAPEDILGATWFRPPTAAWSGKYLQQAGFSDFGVTTLVPHRFVIRFTVTGNSTASLQRLRIHIFREKRA